MIRSSIEWWLLSVQYPLVWTHAVVPAVMGEPVLMDSPQQRNIFDCGMLLVFAVKAILDAPDSDFCGMGPDGTDDTPMAPPDWQSLMPAARRVLLNLVHEALVSKKRMQVGGMAEAGDGTR